MATPIVNDFTVSAVKEILSMAYFANRQGIDNLDFGVLNALTMALPKHPEYLENIGTIRDMEIMQGNKLPQLLTMEINPASTWETPLLQKVAIDQRVDLKQPVRHTSATGFAVPFIDFEGSYNLKTPIYQILEGIKRSAIKIVNDLEEKCVTTLEAQKNELALLIDKINKVEWNDVSKAIDVLITTGITLQTSDYTSMNFLGSYLRENKYNSPMKPEFVFSIGALDNFEKANIINGENNSFNLNALPKIDVSESGQIEKDPATLGTGYAIYSGGIIKNRQPMFEREFNNSVVSPTDTINPDLFNYDNWARFIMDMFGIPIHIGLAFEPANLAEVFPEKYTSGNGIVCYVSCFANIFQMPTANMSDQYQGVLKININERA